MLDLSLEPLRSVSAKRFLASIAILALFSCAEPHKEHFTAADETPPYLAVNSKQQPGVHPEAASRGSFVVTNGCVVFKRVDDGLMFTPIFPRGSRVVPIGRGSFEIIVRNSRVPLGKEVRTGGGEVVLPNYTEAALESPVPATCPDKYWIIGSISIL